MITYLEAFWFCYMYFWVGYSVALIILVIWLSGKRTGIDTFDLS